MNPLPPSAVRRKGDRLRRRNTIVAGVGAALAVALIATPIAALSGGDEGPEPAPKPDRATEWVQTIPAEFPLDDMMGGEGSAIPARVDDQEPYGEIVIPAVEACGSVVWAPQAAADVLGAVWSDGVEGGEQRTLAVYGDDEAARDALAEIESAVVACTPRGPRDFELLGLDSDLGEQSYAWVQRWRAGGEPTGDTDVWQVAQVGNALLLDKTYVPDADPVVSQQTAEILADRASSVVDAMCVFSAEGCEPPLPPPAEPASMQIPDDFPLADGWPESDGDTEIIGPDRERNSLQFRACAPIVPAVGHVDRLRADFNAPEDYRVRQLTTYSDTQAAAADVTRLVDAHRACPQDEVDQAGYVTEFELHPLDVGDDAWAIVARDTVEGAPTPFGATTVLVRVGSAVLILDHGGHAGYPGDDWRAGADATLADASVPIAEMCLFTDAGC